MKYSNLIKKILKFIRTRYYYHIQIKQLLTLRVDADVQNYTEVYKITL